MNLIRRIMGLAAKKSPAASTRSGLPAGGRSSVENVDAQVRYLNQKYNGRQPYDPAFLAVLQSLSIYSPVVSQALKLLGGAINTGHDLIIEGPKRAADRARDLLGDLAPAIYRRSAGVDGLINHYTRQLAITGALSAEDVLEPDLSALKEVVLVPASAIRFKLEDGNWLPLQVAGGGEVELNRRTYAYYALDTLEGHPPFGVPPFSSVIEPEAMQGHILGHLKFIVEKMGAYGITSVGMPPPPRLPGESENEYQTRCQQYLDTAAQSYQKLLRDGLLVYPGGDNGHKIEHHDIAKSAGNVDAIMKSVEQLLMSGLGIDPAMFGRSFSTTETYAGVVYNLLIRYAGQFQRIIKRRLERSYRLALLLDGIQGVDVSVSWADQPSLNPHEDAQAETYRTETAIAKVEAGIITLDQAAQELGYEKAANPGAKPGAAKELSARRVLNARPGGRGYGPVNITVLAAGGDGDDEKRFAVLGAEDDFRAYLNAVEAVDGEVREKVLDAVEELLGDVDRLSEEDFAARVFATAAKAHGQGWADEAAKAAVREGVSRVYRNARLLSDLSGLERRDWTWGAPERRVLDFSAKLENFYFGRYLENDSARARTIGFLRSQYLEHGAGLFGRQDPAVLAAFRAELDKELRVLSDSRLALIADTSVQRMRSWASVQQLQEAGARWARVWAVLDEKTSAVCREMHGRIIPVADLGAEVNHLSGLSPDSFEAHLRLNGTPGLKDIRLNGAAGLKARNALAPPYHPRCRTRLLLSLKPAAEIGEPPQGLSPDQERAWRYWAELPEEARGRVLADAAGAEWARPGKMKSHTYRHPEVGADADAYQKMVGRALASPDKVLIRVNSAGKMQASLVKGGGNDWFLAIIDPDARNSKGAATIRTCYGPKADRPVDWEKRFSGLSKEGWVEVM